jgi:hypothetical protein
MSLYNSLPERGYDVRVWPARYPEKPEKYADRLAPIIADALAADPSLAGQPTDNLRFDNMDLMEREASYGRSGFALQFQLDTSLSDADRHPLRLSDLMAFGFTPELLPVKVAWGSSPEQIRNDLPVVGLAGDRWYRPMFITPDMVAPQGVVMAIDPSGRGTDETGYAVIAMCNGYLYVLEAGGLAGGYSDATLETLAHIAKRNKVTWITIEPNFGDGMFDKLFAPVLNRVYPCTIDPDPPRSSIQKEKRIIDTLEPVFNQHRIVFHEKIVQRDAEADDTKFQLFYQLTRITKDKGSLAKYDRLDALAMAVAYWVGVMDKDTQKVVDEHRAAMLMKELACFHAAAGVASPQGNNWMNLG